MSLLSGLIVQLLHIALIAVAAPTLIGALHWMQARLSGHLGPPLLQPWRELRRLLRKQPVRAESASAITDQAPIACAAATVVAACLVPSFALGMLFAPLADILLIFGLLIAARCSLVLIAADAGTALGGVAASRAALLGCLAEPVLLAVILPAALLAGSINLDVVAAVQQQGGWQIGGMLALVALLVVAVVDTACPEALEEQLSGPDLALVEASAALRLLVWFNLIGAMFLPSGMAPAGTADPAAWLFGMICWLCKTVLFAAVLAGVNAAVGQINLRRATTAFGVALLLVLLATGFLLVETGFAQAAATWLAA
jgi:formate hydrogenlyase subunit 4